MSRGRNHHWEDAYGSSRLRADSCCSTRAWEAPARGAEGWPGGLPAAARTDGGPSRGRQQGRWPQRQARVPATSGQPHGARADSADRARTAAHGGAATDADRDEVGILLLLLLLCCDDGANGDGGAQTARGWPRSEVRERRAAGRGWRRRTGRTGGGLRTMAATSSHRIRDGWTTTATNRRQDELQRRPLLHDW